MELQYTPQIYYIPQKQTIIINFPYVLVVSFAYTPRAFRSTHPETVAGPPFAYTLTNAVGILFPAGDRKRRCGGRQLLLWQRNTWKVGWHAGSCSWPGHKVLRYRQPRNLESHPRSHTCEYRHIFFIASFNHFMLFFL